MARFMITTIQPKSLSVRKSKVKNGEILVLPHPTLLSSPSFGDPMEITFQIIISICLIIIIALSAFMLYREFSQVNGRVNKLEEKSAEKSLAIQGLEARMQKIEQANSLRMPHKAQDNVLDVIAIVSDVLENKQDLHLLEKQRREREEKHLQDALCRLKEAMSVGTKREEK